MKILNLADLLRFERCHVITQTQSERKVFELISKTLCNPMLEESANSIFQCFINREQLGSTAIGNGIAIPHCRSQYTNSIKGCLITLKDSVDLQAQDKREVDLFFALIAPEEIHEEHSDLLSKIANVFENAIFCQKLRECRSSKELYETFLNHEELKAIAS